MDALTAKVSEALIAEGACPATATFLATDFVAKAAKRIVRDKRELDAMQALFSPAVEDKPAACQCHRSTVYRRAARARRKSRLQQPSATNPA